MRKAALNGECRLLNLPAENAHHTNICEFSRGPVQMPVAWPSLETITTFVTAVAPRTSSMYEIFELN